MYRHQSFAVVTYQISFKLAEDETCSSWTRTEIGNKVNNIEHQICMGVADTCNLLRNTCDTLNFIKNDSRMQHGYRCLLNQLPHTLFYDIIFQEIAEGNTTYLIDCLEKWIYSDALTRIPVNKVELYIDKSCCQVLDKQNTPGCSSGSTLTMAHGLGIGFGVSSAVILLLIVIIVGMVIWYRR